jgi:hypothetical protein
MRTITTAAASLAVAASGLAHSAAAGTVDIEGGQTNVALDFDTLQAAANLFFIGVSDDVIAPGDIPDSVAFPINERDPDFEAGDDDDEELPTTFAYDALDFLGSFSGTIEHTGTVQFLGIPAGPILVGDFTIGFDADRAGTLDGNASGFFVASTSGVEAVLFDVSVSSLFASRLDLDVGGDLLVSPEFAGLLLTLGQTDLDLAGADVGDYLIDGTTGCSGVDFNDDGPVDIRDVIWFVVAADNGNPEIDFNADGIFDLRDLAAFVAHFNDCHDN